MTINQRFDYIIKTLYHGNKSAFATAIGVRPSVVENIVGKRQGKPSFDVLEKTSAIAEIDIRWLVSGKECLESIQSMPNEAYSKSELGIPLIPIEAMAGFLSGEVNVNDSDCERLNIPGLKADFVIPVSGDSMEPKYFSGDYVACQNVNLSDMFFQWGKVYVIDTNQGVLIKKVKKGIDSDSVLLISENPEYDPIPMPCVDIYHIALVKGLVRII